MPDTDAAEMKLLVSRVQAENAFRDAMALFVGRGRRFSVEQLAKGIGLPKKDDGKQVTKPIYDFMSYQSGDVGKRPFHMGLMLSVTAFLGAEFTNEWIKLCGQGAFDLPDEEPDPGELAADTSEDSAKVVRMAADRDFSNDDPDQLRTAGTRLMNHGMKLVAVSARRKRA